MGQGNLAGKMGRCDFGQLKVGGKSEATLSGVLLFFRNSAGLLVVGIISLDHPYWEDQPS